MLASFLRKNHRDLRLATLYCLDAIFQGYSQYTLISPGSGAQSMSSVTANLYKAVLDELPVLICDNDLHISQLVLTLLCTIMDVNPECIPAVQEFILPNTLKLVLSSLLQGSAMSACLLFFTKLVQLHLPGLDFHAIFRVSLSLYHHAFSLISTSIQCSPLPPDVDRLCVQCWKCSGWDHPQTSKCLSTFLLCHTCTMFMSSWCVCSQAYRSISKCIASICDSVPSETFQTVDKFITDIKVREKVPVLCPTVTF